VGHDPKPSPHSRSVERQLAASHVPVGMEGTLPLPADQAGDASRVVARHLLPFLLRDDGWLRVTPQDDGETVYFKWKWTAGKHVNHYVMSVYPASESAEALRVLAIKVHAVDRGEKAPVKDHYFKG